MLHTQLHPKTNVPTKYQHPTPYSFGDTASTKFERSRSLQQGHSHTMMFHTYTPKPFPYQLILHLTNLKCQGHYCKVKGQIKVTPHLHSPINVLSKYELLTLTVSEILPGQDYCPWCL